MCVCVGAHKKKLECVRDSGCVWMCVDVCGCVWMCVDVCGCVWDNNNKSEMRKERNCLFFTLSQLFFHTHSEQQLQRHKKKMSRSAGLYQAFLCAEHPKEKLEAASHKTTQTNTLSLLLPGKRRMH